MVLVDRLGWELLRCDCGLTFYWLLVLSVGCRTGRFTFVRLGGCHIVQSWIIDRILQVLGKGSHKCLQDVLVDFKVLRFWQLTELLELFLLH